MNGTVGRDGELARALARVAAGRGLLIAGPAGVGKSHLLRALAAGLDDSHDVTMLAGLASTRRVPFGTVAHLLGPELPPHRGLLIATVRRALVAGQDGRNCVLVVDDLDLVDDDTSSVIASLAAVGDTVVAATCRTESVATRDVAPLWKDGALDRLDLGPLSRADSERLGSALLGGPMSRALSGRLWEASRGNPMFLRELVLAGRESGAIASSGDFHDLVDTLAPGRRLAELVAARVGDLEDDVATALSLVALTEPVDVAVLGSLATPASLAELERRQLVTVGLREGATVGDQPHVRMAHPLMGEVVRERIGHFQRRRLLERVVATRRQHDDADTALRFALWLLEVGQEPEPELALDAARVALARFDHATAARLASAVDPPTSEALVVLARARAGQGDTAMAVSDLQRAVEAATDDEARLEAISAMIEVIGLVGGDLGRANTRLAAAIAATDDRTRRQELRVRALVVAGLGGRFSDALELAPVLDDRDLKPPAEAHGLMALTLAQSMIGKLDDVDERLDRAEHLARRLELDEPYLREQVGLNRVLVCHARARFDDARDLVDAVVQADHGRRLVGPWLFVGAVGALHTGDLQTAARHTAEAHDRLVEVDPLGVRGLAAALAATVAGMRGRSTVDGWIARAEEVGRDGEVRISGWLALARGWSHAWAGDPVAGATSARDGGMEAIAGEHLVWGATVLHGATRMGQPDLVVDALAALPPAGALVDLLQQHTHVASTRDADGLTAVATDLESVSADAVAVDAWATAAALHGPDSVAGRRAALRAHELSRGCPGLRSWPLQDLAVPVTARQRQVGRLAARGWESRRIADHLALATKTVDNHLQRLYSAIAIDGRRELATAFPDDRIG